MMFLELGHELAELLGAGALHQVGGVQHHLAPVAREVPILRRTGGGVDRPILKARVHSVGHVPGHLCGDFPQGPLRSPPQHVGGSLPVLLGISLRPAYITSGADGVHQRLWVHNHLQRPFKATIQGGESLDERCSLLLQHSSDAVAGLVDRAHTQGHYRALGQSGVEYRFVGAGYARASAYIKEPVADNIAPVLSRQVRRTLSGMERNIGQGDT